jgi:hypothetical protein
VLVMRQLLCRHGPAEVEIAAMSSDLDDRAAVLFFPEGANSPPAAEAEWARGMQHVSAPRPGGALAAIEAATDADVAFLGHVGFPRSIREVWRLLPHPQTGEVRLWAEPAENVPADREEAIDCARNPAARPPAITAHGCLRPKSSTSRRIASPAAPCPARAAAR